MHGLHLFLTDFYSADCLAVSKEKVTQSMLLAAAIGFIGVLCVLSLIPVYLTYVCDWLECQLLAAMAFVTVRALTQTEPPERLCFISV